MFLYLSLSCCSSDTPSTLLPQGLCTCCFVYVELFLQITGWLIPAYLSGICLYVTSSEGPSLLNLHKIIYSLTLYYILFFFIVFI